MSGLSTWFGWTVSDTNNAELPAIFPLDIKKDDFIKTDMINIFLKILTDVMERTAGLKDDQTALLFDNCVKSNSSDGLLSRLAKAMTDKKDLYLVYEKAVDVIREATHQEQQQIKADYEKSSKSSAGVYISFKNFVRADMVKLYSSLEYSTIGALSKSMNLSKAIQFKMHDMRGSTGLGDSAQVTAKALAVAKGLGQGKDILLDAKDMIESHKPDLTATKEAITFLDSKRCFYLGLPSSYINGEQTGGLGTTGENDTKAIERGLKSYFFSIIKPVIDAIFGVKLTYKSQDFRQITQALEAMKTFDLVSEDYLTLENKKKIIEGLLDVREEDNKTTPAEEVSVPPADPKLLPGKPEKREIA